MMLFQEMVPCHMSRLFDLKFEISHRGTFPAGNDSQARDSVIAYTHAALAEYLSIGRCS